MDNGVLPGGFFTTSELLRPSRAAAAVFLAAAVLAGCVTPASAPPPAKPAPSRSAQKRWPVSSYPEFRLLAHGRGWRFGDGVHVTDNGGRSWHAVTPRAVDSHARVTGFALDASRAWVAANVDGHVRVFRTGDGGAQWRAAARAVADHGVPAALQFSDARHGHLLVALDAGMSHQGVALFATGDGGRTWHEVAGSRAGYFRGPLMIGPLDDICCLRAVTFKNADDGWISGFYGVMQKPYFEVTHDGGHHWASQPLPLTEAERHAYSSFGAPTFFDARHGVLAAAFAWPGQHHSRLLVFHTNDGGAHWTAASPLTNDGSAAVRAPLASFIDPRRGWAFLGDTLYRTDDGGAHWRAVATGLHEWNALQFANARTGWARAPGRLLATDDDGRTWRTLVKLGSG